MRASQKQSKHSDDWTFSNLSHLLGRLIVFGALIGTVGIGAGIVTYAIRAQDPPTYEVVARFAITPSQELLGSSPADLVESVAALDRPIVNATVSELLQSGLVAEHAARSIGIPDEELGDYDFTAHEVPGAAIVRLAITGPDADRLELLASAVRESDLAIAREFVGVFEVTSIDGNDFTAHKIAPNPTKDAIAVTFAVMIALGVAVALFEGRRHGGADGTAN